MNPLESFGFLLFNVYMCPIILIPSQWAGTEATPVVPTSPLSHKGPFCLGSTEADLSDRLLHT